MPGSGQHPAFEDVLADRVILTMTEAATNIGEISGTVRLYQALRQQVREEKIPRLLASAQKRYVKSQRDTHGGEAQALRDIEFGQVLLDMALWASAQPENKLALDIVKNATAMARGEVGILAAISSYQSLLEIVPETTARSLIETAQQHFIAGKAHTAGGTTYAAQISAEGLRQFWQDVESLGRM